MKKTTFGIIIGNRGFFPGHLCREGRKLVLKVLREQGCNAVILPEKETPHSSVESLEDARKCAGLFKQNKEKIDGIIVTLPNFGDERAVANTLRWSELDVPVLIQATPDDPGNMTVENRRDGFCGKISVANSLRQYGIPYSLTTLHTCALDSEEFLADLRQFAAACRVVKGLKNARVGAIGARTGPFNTVRYSEKLLESSGISVEVIDLFEVFGMVNKLKDADARVKRKIAALKKYITCEGIPAESLLKMAKLGLVIDDWMKEKELIGSAIQCWTAMEEYYGIVPCALMSFMSNNLRPSACEVDVMGLVGMLALQFATGNPSAIVDWNNNCGGDPDKCVVFHCSNLPKDIFSSCQMNYQAIIANAVGEDNAYGTVSGRIAPGGMTFCRVSTDDLLGEVAAYVGEGAFTDDKLETFGGYGVMRVPRLQKLLRYCCENGFEHHVAVNRGRAAKAVHEAFTKYLGWPCYHHNEGSCHGDNSCCGD